MGVACLFEAGGVASKGLSRVLQNLVVAHQRDRELPPVHALHSVFVAAEGWLTEDKRGSGAERGPEGRERVRVRAGAGTCKERIKHKAYLEVHK